MDRSVEGFILVDTVLKHSLKLPVVAVAGIARSKALPMSCWTSGARGVDAAASLPVGHRKIAFMRGGSHSSDADDRGNV